MLGCGLLKGELDARDGPGDDRDGSCCRSASIQATEVDARGRRARRVAWFDITTTDLAKSKAFYGKLFDWTFNPVQGTNQAVEIVSGGSAIGTIRGAEGQISPFNGVVYVQVLDIRESCKKAKDLGGTLVPGFPFDLPNGTGAIGLVSDPTGHPVGMYSRTPLAPPKPSK